MAYPRRTPRAPAASESEFWKICGRRIKITDTLLVLFTFCLAAATFALWLATRDLVTGESETSKRQLRAYIGVAVGRIEKFGSSTPVEGSVIVKNFGQTPAYDLTQIAAILVESLPFTGPFADLLPGRTGPPKRIALLNPTQDFLAGAAGAKPFTDAEVVSINDGNKFRLHLFGKITYLDALKERHYTNFCFDYTGEMIRTNRGVDICDFYGAD
jgi:hypothetical protein